MSNSDPLAGCTLVVLTMKYTTRAAFNELDKFLGVFLIVRPMKDQFRLPNIPFYTNFQWILINLLYNVGKFKASNELKLWRGLQKASNEAASLTFLI
jgi:hypothetical protein